MSGGGKEADGAGGGRIAAIARALPAARARERTWERTWGAVVTPSPFAALLERARTGLATLLAREAAAFDLALAIPMFLGIGIILYFAAPQEPGLAAPAAVSVLALALAWACRARHWLCVILCCAAAVPVGFTAATLRTVSVAAPQIARPMTAMVTGVVLSLDRRAKGGARLILRPTSIEKLAAADMPARIRVTARLAEGIEAGAAVTFKALLRPPPPPALPGGYDFARDAFFDGIGAVGFVAGRVLPAAGPVAIDRADRLAAALDRSRNALTDRIVAAIPGVDGAVAASQVTGKRGLIPEEANAALRAAGLYHVVSISGLHMALFAGALFWLIRAVLALSSHIALRWPLKAVAALLSLGPAGAYTLFSGAEVATVRSFLMTALVLTAIALRRTAVTRRNVALAASFVLLTTPEEVLGPSFQMSFGAVAMLVAWYDRPRQPGRRPPQGWAEQVVSKLAITVYALLLTTLIASLATAPFAAYHFHRLTLQGLVSNMLATPIVSGLIMPLGLLALVAEPFGYGPPLWSAMGTAVGWFMDVAYLSAAWPGSNLVVPQFPAVAMAAFAATLVLLTVLRTRFALVAALPLLAGIALAATAERPDAIIGAGGRAALVRNGRDLALIAKPAEAFAAQNWLLAMGDSRPPQDPALAAAVRCDPEGCAAPLDAGLWLIIDRTPNAVEEDCGRVAVLVSSLVVPIRCRDGGIVLDRGTMDAAGAVALYRETNHVDSASGAPAWRVLPARADGLDRPWAPHRPAAKPPQPVNADAPADPGPTSNPDDQ